MKLMRGVREVLVSLVEARAHERHYYWADCCGFFIVSRIISRCSFYALWIIGIASSGRIGYRG